MLYYPRMMNREYALPGEGGNRLIDSIVSGLLSRGENIFRKEKTAHAVHFSTQQREALKQRGRTWFGELNAETLAMLEAQTGTKSRPYGVKAKEAAMISTMRGVEVAINLDHAIPEETYGKPFIKQLVFLGVWNRPIDGVTDISPETLADVLTIALKVENETGINILSDCSTRVGKDGSLVAGFLNPGVSVIINDCLSPDASASRVGLLSMSVPTRALGR